MADDLTPLLVRVSTVLQDSAGNFWSQAELIEAVKSALAEYSRVLPRKAEVVFTITAAGNRVTLPAASFPGLDTVTEVYWPWSSTKTIENQAPNLVSRWSTTWLATGPILTLKTWTGQEPAVGEKIFVRYERAHEIGGLGTATTTSLSADHLTYIAKGAAAFAASMGMMDRNEVLNADDLRKWGWQRLTEFRAELAKIVELQLRGDSAVGGVWKQDKWDGSY